MQSNATYYDIAKRCFYIACLNNYMFRPLYQPSSGCTLSYYKPNYTIYNVLCCICLHFTDICVLINATGMSHLKDIIIVIIIIITILITSVFLYFYTQYFHLFTVEVNVPFISLCIIMKYFLFSFDYQVHCTQAPSNNSSLTAVKFCFVEYLLALFLCLKSKQM